MATPRRFKIEIQAGPSGTVAKLIGGITEESRLDVERFPQGKPAVLDVGDVAYLNSLGVRDWIFFLEALCRRAPVTIRRLSPVMVFQANAIRGFLAQARLESYLSPWDCPQCRHTLEVEHRADEDLPPSVGCPKCGVAMVLDALPKWYLAFRQA